MGFDPKGGSSVPKLALLQAEGGTVELAREALSAKSLAVNAEVVCEEVVSDGKPFNLDAAGDTVDEAFNRGEQQLPPEATILERTILSEPGWKEIAVKARDETSARELAASKIATNAAIKKIELAKTGRKGILGVGRTDDEYRIQVWQSAVVRISAANVARLRWTVQISDAATATENTILFQWLERCASLINDIATKRGLALRPYLPGQPKFICAQDRCTNPCCKFSPSHLVVVYKEFADAVESQYGIQQEKFVATWPGFCVLKTREQSRCVFVDDRNQCTVYGIRPHQCVSYPFELAFFSLTDDGRLALENTTDVYRTAEMGRDRTIEFYRKTTPYHFLLPLVVYDSSCPGFTGDPISPEEYLRLAFDLFEPCRRSNALVRYY